MHALARPALALLMLAALTLWSAGCGEGDAGEGDASGGGGGRSRAKKDRGDASMKLGDRAWAGTSARARLGKTGTLRISTSHNASVDGKRRRESLTIVINDYKGVGQYTASPRGSTFVAVSLDVGDIEDANTDEAAAEELTKALTGSQVMMLTGLVVNVTAASDTQIEGTFEYTPRPGSKQPSMRDGRFRAIVKK